MSTQHTDSTDSTSWKPQAGDTGTPEPPPASDVPSGDFTYGEPPKPKDDGDESIPF